MTVDRIRVVLQKGYVLYGITALRSLCIGFYGVLTEWKNDFDKSVCFVWIIWYGFSVNPPFGQLELYVFGQDWPKAIRPTENSVNKGPTIFIVKALNILQMHSQQNLAALEAQCWELLVRIPLTIKQEIKPKTS